MNRRDQMDNSEVINLAENLLSFTSNVFLIKGDEPTLVDAGNDQTVLKNLKEEVDDIEKVLLTHFHPDHVGLAPVIQEEYDAKVMSFKKDTDYVDEEISDEQEIKAGNSKLTALHTPGHYPNHLVFCGDGALFSGDLVFPGGSFGRTDVPGGDSEKLKSSIKKVLEKFQGEIKELYPGHMQVVSDNAETIVKESLEMAQKY